mgnify:CR=1 FL=1
MNKGNLNKLVTNYPVELTEEEIENLSGTLAPVIAACGGGGGGTGGKIYTGIGFVSVNNTTNQIGLTNEANTKLNQDIPTKVSDLSDSANYQTVAGMDQYLTSANAQTLYQTKNDMSAYLTSANASSTYQTKDDMSAYATKDWTNTNFISEQELAGSVVPVVENAGFAYKSYVNDELNKKENKLTFVYDNNKITSINGSALAGQGGTTYSAGAGIAIVDEYISLSADYIQAITQVSGKQDKLEFTYDNSGSIIKINNSAIAGGAGGGSVSYTGRNGVEINGNYIELETAAKNAIDSVAGISTDVGTLKTASANWNEVSAKLDSSLASTTYQTKSDMSNYLTTSDAASTYQHIGNYATKSDINDMATQTWVVQQGFYTKASGDNDYAPKSVTATVNTLTGASAGWNEVSSKLGTAQYATDSATFLKQSDLDDYYQKTDTSSKDELSDEFAKYVTSSNVTTQDTDYVMTTTGWKVLTLPGGGMTQVIHDETLTGQGNANDNKLGVAWSALSGNTINSALSAGSATSALSAEDALSSRYAKQLQDASKTIQISDVTALQNWASSNSSTWDAVSAKLGTAQYATDSATFVTKPDTTQTVLNNNYLIYSTLTGEGTTTGWMPLSANYYSKTEADGRYVATADVGSGLYYSGSSPKLGVKIGTDLAFDSNGFVQVNVGGNNIVDSSHYAFIVGVDHTASGQGAFAGGYGTHTSGVGNFIYGTYLNFDSGPNYDAVSNTPVFVGGTLNATTAQNYNDHGGYLQIMGNGTYQSQGQGTRSDAYILYRDGSISAAGKISANGMFAVDSAATLIGASRQTSSHYGVDNTALGTTWMGVGGPGMHQGFIKYTDGGDVGALDTTSTIQINIKPENAGYNGEMTITNVNGETTSQSKVVNVPTASYNSMSSFDNINGPNYMLRKTASGFDIGAAVINVTQLPQQTEANAYYFVYDA